MSGIIQNSMVGKGNDGGPEPEEPDLCCENPENCVWEFKANQLYSQEQEQIKALACSNELQAVTMSHCFTETEVARVLLNMGQSVQLRLPASSADQDYSSPGSISESVVVSRDNASPSSSQYSTGSGSSCVKAESCVDEAKIFNLGCVEDGQESFYVVPSGTISYEEVSLPYDVVREEMVESDGEVSEPTLLLELGAVENSTAVESHQSKNLHAIRVEMGPYLRILSAVLELTGMKNVSDYVPYEIIKRFHPTDMYRTILKATESRSVGSKPYRRPLDLKEPDWKQWKQPPIKHEEEDVTSGREPRILYNSLFGIKGDLEDNGCIIRIPSRFEVDGQPSFAPDVVSTIGTANFNVNLNLERVAEKCLNMEHKGPNLPLVMTLREPKCIGLLYDTGRVTVIGTKSFEQFRAAARRFGRMIQKIGINVRLTDLKMQFYVGIVKLPFNIDVQALADDERLSQSIKYDSSFFPGVVMFLKSTSVLCLIFETGAIVMAEVRKPDDMKVTLDKIYPCLRQFGY